MDRNEIQKKWSEMRNSDPLAKRMTCENVVNYFIQYFNRNSYGYENCDLSFVIRELGFANVDEASARNFFYMYVKGKYGNFKRNRNRSFMEEAMILAQNH